MKIRFIGAADNHVTGSCTHFSFERKNVQFLVDCGLYQGEAHASLKNESAFPFDPADIKFVLLTHAHIDHCGLIPKLYRDGFKGSVFCTTATAEFTRLSLIDGLNFSDGLYSESDVKKIKFSCVDQRPDFGLSRHIPIDEDLFAAFTRSAHILGAVSINLSWQRDDGSRGSIVMSGDLGNNTKDNPYQPLLAGRQEPFGTPDYMVVESTYGNRIRDTDYSNYDHRLSALSSLVKEAALNRKKILIPAFSLQRTQEILFDLICIFRSSNSIGLPSEKQILPLRVIEECITQGWWPEHVNARIGQALNLASEEVQNIWKSAAIECSPDNDEEDALRFSFPTDAKVSFDDFRRLLVGYTNPLKLKLLVDSPLTLKMTGVFSAELNRRQRKNPDETLYRNRKMAERLEATSEDEVDDILKTIFPKNIGLENAVTENISVGNHKLIYYKALPKKISYSKKPVSTATKNVAPQSGDITISGSGMCAGGRILEHLPHFLISDKSVILITGYMDPGTLGGQLAELAQCLDDGSVPSFTELKIGKSVIPLNDVKAKIVNFGSYYSGHTDQAGLLEFIFTNNKLAGPDEAEKSTTVFINHGHREARFELQKVIEGHDRLEGQRLIKEVQLASSEKWYDLDAHTWLDPLPLEESIPSKMFNELLNEQKKTNQLLEKLIKAIEESSVNTLRSHQLLITSIKND